MKIETVRTSKKVPLHKIKSGKVFQYGRSVFLVDAFGIIVNLICGFIKDPS